MFCIYCGNKLDGDSVFCPRCGKKVSSGEEEKTELLKAETTPVVAETGTSDLEEEMKPVELQEQAKAEEASEGLSLAVTEATATFCIYCGNKLDDDSVFCPRCGKRQDGVVMEKPSRAEASPFTEKRSQTSEETAKGEKPRSIVLLVLLIAEMVFAPVCIAYTEAKGDSYDRVDILYISFFLLTATILGYAFSSRICKFVTRKNHMNRGKAVLGEILSLLLVAVLFVVYVLYLAILCRFIDFLA